MKEEGLSVLCDKMLLLMQKDTKVIADESGEDSGVCNSEQLEDLNVPWIQYDISSFIISNSLPFSIAPELVDLI